MATQTLGIVDAIWNGKQIDCEKGSSFSAGGLINNPVVAGRRLYSSQEWKQGEVEIVTVFKAGDSLSGLYTTTAAELQIKCDTGQVFTWASVNQTGDRPKVTGGDGGKVTLHWSVDEPMELINA
jgi:hypothetical protein